MKESISYSFLLNIVVLFIFICFAIVMGILSYYRAFKANAMIIESIEKYEGFNCVSKAEISKKLNTIAYNTPFNVNCNSIDGNCVTDENHNYAVVSYDLDFEGTKIYGNEMNSSYKCDGPDGACKTNKHYQYGVYTYMYVDLPIVSNILRLPVFGKSDILYEFRNFYVYSKNDRTIVTDVESSFDGLYTREMNSGILYVNDSYKSNVVIDDNGKLLDAHTVTAKVLLTLYTGELVGSGSGYNFNEYGEIDLFSDPNVSHSFNYKNYFIIMDSRKNLGDTVQDQVNRYGFNGNSLFECGHVKDFSI